MLGTNSQIKQYINVIFCIWPTRFCSQPLTLAHVCSLAAEHWKILLKGDCHCKGSGNVHYLHECPLLLLTPSLSTPCCLTCSLTLLKISLYWRRTSDRSRSRSQDRNRSRSIYIGRKITNFLSPEGPSSDIVTTFALFLRVQLPWAMNAKPHLSEAAR